MKKLFLAILTVLTFALQAQAWNYNREIIENPSAEHEVTLLQSYTWKLDLPVDDSTYLWNVAGYGCPVPGIAVQINSLDKSLYPDWLDFGVDPGETSLYILDPNFLGCKIPRGTVYKSWKEILVPGRVMPLEVTRRLYQIKTSSDRGLFIYLVELYDAELGGIKIGREDAMSITPQASP